jgi:hypothetical protein
VSGSSPAYAESSAAQAAVNAAKKALAEAQQAREANDPTWDSALQQLPRAVEYVLGGNVTLIKQSIKPWG